MSAQPDQILIRRRIKSASFDSQFDRQVLTLEAWKVDWAGTTKLVLVVAIDGPVKERGVTFKHRTELTINDFKPELWNVTDLLIETRAKMDQGDTFQHRELSIKTAAGVTVGYREYRNPVRTHSSFLNVFDPKLNAVREIILNAEELKAVEASVHYLFV